LATPRLAETPSGVINAVGFPGPGVEDFVAVELPWLVEHDIPVVASIVADTAAEYGRIAQLLRQVPGILAIEVNLSNPVTQPGRQAFSMNAAAAAGVVHVVRRNTATSMPVFAKLSGDTTDIVDVAQSCVHAGAAALSLINAVRAVGIDTRRNRPALATPIGGLSGPAIKPIALRAVWEVHAQMPDVPIIASGGVATATDALEMLLAGASAVAIGSALLSDPAAGHRIAAGLQELLVQRDTTAAEVRGAAHAASASRTTPGQEW
jgi:dihydroorotate dehydrogenase (NAD+) catalytic subunit